VRCALGAAASVLALIGALPSATASPAQADQPLIAYERWVGDGSPDYEIWLMESDGSRQRKLTDGCCFDWSPDGRSIAFAGENGRHLSTINVDGTGLRRLAGFVDGAPSWSPDGARLSYAGKDGLFVVAAAAGTPARITHGKDDSPDWSPNGRKIVFERYMFRPNENGQTIFVVNADGSGVRQLTMELGQREPTWSPGGKKIAYLGWDDAAYEDGLYVMNADGPEQDVIARPGGGDHDWSPGGGRIVFVEKGAIHTIRPDGRRHKRIARGRNHEPQWSPDGSSIVFGHVSRNKYEIYVMSAAGKNVSNLTNTPRPVLEASPAWSPARR
jgi:TolB protein